jgi:hypothetical protein
MDGSRMNDGFYRLEGETLSHAPNFVYTPEFALIKEDKDEYILLDIFPMDGWYWFDSDNEAYAFFGLEKPQTDEKPRRMV